MQQKATLALTTGNGFANNCYACHIDLIGISEPLVPTTTTQAVSQNCQPKPSCYLVYTTTGHSWQGGRKKTIPSKTRTLPTLFLQLPEPTNVGIDLKQPPLVIQKKIKQIIKITIGGGVALKRAVFAFAPRHRWAPSGSAQKQSIP